MAAILVFRNIETADMLTYQASLFWFSLGDFAFCLFINYANIRTGMYVQRTAY